MIDKERKYLGKKGRYKTDNSDLRDDLLGVSFIFVEHSGMLRKQLLDGDNKGHEIVSTLHYEGRYWDLIPNLNSEYDIEE